MGGGGCLYLLQQEGLLSPFGQVISGEGSLDPCSHHNGIVEAARAGVLLGCHGGFLPSSSLTAEPRGGDRNKVQASEAQPCPWQSAFGPWPGGAFANIWEGIGVDTSLGL